MQFAIYPPLIFTSTVSRWYSMTILTAVTLLASQRRGELYFGPSTSIGRSSAPDRPPPGPGRFSSLRTHPWKHDLRHIRPTPGRLSLRKLNFRSGPASMPSRSWRGGLSRRSLFFRRTLDSCNCAGRLRERRVQEASVRVLRVSSRSPSRGGRVCFEGSRGKSDCISGPTNLN